MARILLTLDQAVELTGISKATFRWLRQQNRGPKFGVIAGRLRIYEDDLERWVEQELEATATGGAGVTAATANTKKPEHRRQPVSGVVPTCEEKNVTIVDEKGTVALDALTAPRWAATRDDRDETVYHRRAVGEVDGVGWVSVGESRSRPATVGIVQESWIDDEVDGGVDVAGPAIEVEGAGVTPDSLGGKMAFYVASGAARQLAHLLLEAADYLDGPHVSPADHVPTQYLFVQAIRARIKASPLRQNEVAVAAGYGVSEFSDLMTGKRVMDLGDVERIAHALNVDPFELWTEAAR